MAMEKRGRNILRTEQEVWKEYRELVRTSSTLMVDVLRHKAKTMLEEIEWVLYIGAENEFDEFGKRIGGMQDEVSIREGVYNKELRDWLLGESS